MKTSPEARHFIDREGDDGQPGFLHSQSAELEPRAAEAHRPAVQINLLEAWRDRTGCIRELVADGTIGTSDAVVDGGRSRGRLMGGLEAHVIEKGRISEIFLGNIAGVMNALP